MPRRVVAEVIDWLKNGPAAGWTVASKKPSPLPEKFVTVSRSGGGRESMVLDMAEVLIEVYHKSSDLTASDMADTIADRITELLEVEDITRAEVNSLVSLDDTIAQYYRYQIYCDVFLRR